LSVTERFAAKLATEVGVKVREIRQLVPAASDVPHVLVCVKLPAPAPVIPIPVMVSGALPLLVSCAVCTALVLPVVAINVKEAGVIETIGAGTAVPVPVSETVCGEPEALSAMESVALKAAADEGVKVIEMRQFEPAASDVPQVLVCEKLLAPVPPRVMAVMLSAALPVLLSVTVCAALETPLVAVNVNEDGVTEATGARTGVPVPISEIVWGEAAALSAMESVALKAATDEGVKVTEMLQLKPAGSEVPQALVSAKLEAPVPAIVTPVMVSAALPAFVSCTVCAALEVPLTAVKVSPEGERLASGTLATVPTVTWTTPAAAA
jgi:hypothetical protein